MWQAGFPANTCQTGHLGPIFLHHRKGRKMWLWLTSSSMAWSYQTKAGSLCSMEEKSTRRECWGVWGAATGGINR